MTAPPVLVIGATGAIGGTLCRFLAEENRPLHLAGRNAEALADRGRQWDAPHSLCDATDPASLAALAETAPSEGALGGLAYCVGSITLKPLKAVTEADLLTAWQINVTGALLAVQACAPALAKGQGSVVLFSSVAADQGFSHHAVTGTVKAAVQGLTRSLAAELAPKVRVNAIAPSLTDSAMAAPITGNAAMAKAIAQLHALPRLGRPEDTAALAAFLLSNRAGWITGQVMGVDGGRSSLRTKG